MLETAGEKSVGFGDSTSELEHLREELRLCRLELAQARADQEEVLERQSSVRRSKIKAQKESDVLAKALADVLLRETRERARGRVVRRRPAPREGRPARARAAS